MTGRAVEIRHLGAGDAAAMAALHQTGFAEPWSEDAFTALLADPFTLALGAVAAATDPERLGGFLLLRVVAGEAEVLTFVVAPDHRRRGLGAALLQDALAGALAFGAEEIFLEVAEDNVAAAALYERCGFAEIARRKGYYAAGPGAADSAKDARVLRRSLKEDFGKS